MHSRHQIQEQPSSHSGNRIREQPPHSLSCTFQEIFLFILEIDIISFWTVKNYLSLQYFLWVILLTTNTISGVQVKTIWTSHWDLTKHTNHSGENHEIFEKSYF